MTTESITVSYVYSNIDTISHWLDIVGKYVSMG